MSFSAVERGEQKGDTFECDSRTILNVDTYPPWTRGDIKELKLIKLIRDGFFQYQQANQICYIIAILERNNRLPVVYEMLSFG